MAVQVIITLDDSDAIRNVSELGDAIERLTGLTHEAAWLHAASEYLTTFDCEPIIASMNCQWVEAFDGLRATVDKFFEDFREKQRQLAPAAHDDTETE